ncbi:MAG: DUF86 domain-containing protein [Anaerolineae bacterium]|nr:DUF86 domain-containing protein [Anaerolineae bacterium]
MSSDEIVVLDIIRAARLTIDFKQGLDKAAFLEDIKTQSAILHQLMVMGEAVKRLSMAYREEHSHIPWKVMAGMRDVLIHGYDIVELNEVWKTANVDVPQVLPLLEELIS